MINDRWMRWFILTISLGALQLPYSTIAAEPRTRSMLVFDQSDERGPFYNQIFTSLRRVVDARTDSPVTIYGDISI